MGYGMTENIKLYERLEDAILSLVLYGNETPSFTQKEKQKF
jgi:hypothetical protein